MRTELREVSMEKQLDVNVQRISWITNPLRVYPPLLSFPCDIPDGKSWKKSDLFNPTFNTFAPQRTWDTQDSWRQMFIVLQVSICVF